MHRHAWLHSPIKDVINQAMHIKTKSDRGMLAFQTGALCFYVFGADFNKQQENNMQWHPVYLTRFMTIEANEALWYPVIHTNPQISKLSSTNLTWNTVGVITYKWAIVFWEFCLFVYFCFFNQILNTIMLDSLICGCNILFMFANELVPFQKRSVLQRH